MGQAIGTVFMWSLWWLRPAWHSPPPWSAIRLFPLPNAEAVQVGVVYQHRRVVTRSNWQGHSWTDGVCSQSASTNVSGKILICVCVCVCVVCERGFIYAT